MLKCTFYFILMLLLVEIHIPMQPECYIFNSTQHFSSYITFIDSLSHWASIRILHSPPAPVPVSAKEVDALVMLCEWWQRKRWVETSSSSSAALGAWMAIPFGNLTLLSTFPLCTVVQIGIYTILNKASYKGKTGGAWRRHKSPAKNVHSSLLVHHSTALSGS